MQESSYNLKAVNKKCGFSSKEFPKNACVEVDIGISQINHRTVERYGFDPVKIKNDLKYSVDAGAKVLSWFKKTYKNKEPLTWMCRYNVGTAPMEKVKSGCQRYIKAIERWL